MANTGSLGYIEMIEDFSLYNIGTTGTAGTRWTQSADSSDTAFVPAVAAGRGKHMAGALTTTDNNMIEFCGDTLWFYGQDGYNMIEVLFQVDDVADLAFNIGFNDDSLEAGNTLPVELAAAAWTSTASTFVGLCYDVDATNDDVHCMWVDDDTDSVESLANLRMQGISPVAGKWCMARIELQDTGSSGKLRATFTFSCDGKTATKEFLTNVDRDCGLCLYTGFENRAATAHNVYIKYVKWGQTIPD